MDHKERCDIHYGLVEAVLNSMRIPWGILNQGGLRDDMIGVGLEALVVSSTRFDESRGIKFRTYASSIIKGEMRKYLKKMQAERKLLVPTGKLTESFLNSEMEKQIGEPAETYDWSLVDAVAPQEEPNRTIYYETIVGDATTADIANEVGISHANCRQRKTRIKKKLKEKLNEN